VLLEKSIKPPGVDRPGVKETAVVAAAEQERPTQKQRTQAASWPRRGRVVRLPLSHAPDYIPSLAAGMN
jgi:hypothetical protein